MEQEATMLVEVKLQRGGGEGEEKKREFPPPPPPPNLGWADPNKIDSLIVHLTCYLVALNIVIVGNMVGSPPIRNHLIHSTMATNIYYCFKAELSVYPAEARFYSKTWGKGCLSR